MQIQDKKYKQLFAPVTKVYDPKSNDFVITGYFTSDKVDSVGDIITKDATQKAVSDFRAFPTLRLMHQPIPVGKVVAIGEGDGLEWNQLRARIVSDDAKKLVAEDVLTAMSVGIIVNEAEPVDGSDPKKNPFWMMAGMKVTSYSLVEISLCDVPANRDAIVTAKPNEVHSYTHEAVLFKSVDADKFKASEKPSEIQTLILSKDKFETKEEATRWVKDHDFKVKKDAPDETENSWRYRQFDPDECKEDTYGTKEMTDGVQAVYCVRKGKSLAPPPPEKELMPERFMGDAQGQIEKSEYEKLRKEFDGLSHTQKLQLYYEMLDGSLD